MKKDLTVENMSCDHCVKAIENELKKLPIDKFEVTIGKVSVEFNENRLPEKLIKAAIEEAGYKVIE
ncbi:MAG: heavy-metal-associated domain-containing protein [Ignavibacteriaceae bacterium]|nr:heavy-metal-associated domain-containing protein [Ignavibacteriaceae bacterium]